MEIAGSDDTSGAWPSPAPPHRVHWVCSDSAEGRAEGGTVAPASRPLGPNRTRSQGPLPLPDAVHTPSRVSAASLRRAVSRASAAAGAQNPVGGEQVPRGRCARHCPLRTRALLEEGQQRLNRPPPGALFNEGAV